MSKYLRIEQVTHEQLLREPDQSKMFLQILGEAEHTANCMGLLNPLTPIQDAEIDLLRLVTSYQELRYVCDVLKCRRKMSYPNDWSSKVMSSGLYELIIRRITNQIHIDDFHQQFSAIRKNQ